MEKIYELIAKKEVVLSSLEKEKSKLEQNMANPTLLNNKAQEIEDVQGKIALLTDVTDLSEEAGDDSAKKILEDVKDHYEEMKQAFAKKEGKEESIKDLNKLQEMIDDIIDHELDNTENSPEETESVLESDSSKQKSGLSATGTGPANSREQSKDMSEDTDLPDYSDFGDTG